MPHTPKSCCPKCLVEELLVDGDRPNEYMAVTEPFCSNHTCPCHAPHTEGWEAEFDKEFYLLGMDERDNEGTIQKTAVKSFIRTLLSSHEEGVRAEIASLSQYEVTDDVKTKDGGWKEFYEEKVFKVSDVLEVVTPPVEGGEGNK